MYSLTVRDHMFIAHSLKGEIFGPAQNLHGTTYIIEAEFKRTHLDEHNMVLDMGLASRILKEVVSGLNYRNLDEMEEFKSDITTTEYLAERIHLQIKKKVVSFFKGLLKVTLHESPEAWASYEAEIK
ncbi:MAG: 6-pyruvoyl trahydropterin synthase family protein [Candidatus Aminicenantes bacterium]